MHNPGLSIAYILLFELEFLDKVYWPVWVKQKKKKANTTFLFFAHKRAILILFCFH